jgi:hypothetical protein
VSDKSTRTSMRDNFACVCHERLLALRMHTLDWSLLYLHISRFRDTVLVSQWPLEERVLSLAVPQTRPMVVTTVKHSSFH